MPVAKCSECGGWIHTSEDHRERSGFYAHERCVSDESEFWT